MDDIHTTRHQLCNKGTGKIPDTANNTWPAEAQAPTQVPQGNATLQVVRETNCQNNRFDAGPQHLRGLGLGRVRYNTEVNVRICHQVHGINNPLRQPRAINNCTQQRRSRTILYAINTGATESLHVRNLLQEALNLKKVNIRIHTDSSIEESQTHRAQTSLHPTTRAARPCEDYQDQHSKIHRGHLHQERGHQDALEASQRCWAHNTALLADTNSSESFTASWTQACTRMYTCEQRAYSTHTHKHAFLSWQRSTTSSISSRSLYFNIGYIDIVLFYHIPLQHVRTQHDCGRLWTKFSWIQHARKSTFCLLTTELEKQVADGNTYGFMWLTAEQYAEYVSNTQMTTIPGKSMLLTWRHWIVTTTLHDLFQD